MAYSTVIVPALVAVAPEIDVTRNFARMTEPPALRLTIHDFDGAAVADAPVPVNQPLTAGLSASATKDVAAGTLALVTASNAASWLAGVIACNSATLALALAHRQYAVTPPGPAAPPFTVTPVAKNARSHSVEEDGSDTVTLVAGSPSFT